MRQFFKDYWLGIPLGIYALVWLVIMGETAKAGCEGVGLVDARGPCLVRSLTGLSCFVLYLGVWTWLGGLVAVGKGRSRWLGMVLGFTLQFIGCLFMLTWEIRHTCPRCGKRVETSGLCWDCFMGRTPQ